MIYPGFSLIRIVHGCSFSPHEKFLFIVLDSYEFGVIGYDTTDPQYIEAAKLLRTKNPNEVSKWNKLTIALDQDVPLINKPQMGQNHLKLFGKISWSI